MKAIVLRLIVLGWLAGAAVAAGAASRVLFIGNSYTRFNELPKLFRQMVASTGAAPPEVSASTPGGLTFAQHLQAPGTLKLIDEGHWDVVVLW